MKSTFRSFAVALLLAGGRALACPVCGLGGNSAGQGAYKAMSIMLVGVALIGIGGILGLVMLRARRHSAISPRGEQHP